MSAVAATRQQPGTLAESVRKKLRAFALRDTGPALLGLSPALLYIFALVGFPLLLALYTSLTDVTITDQSVGDAKFVGLSNYATALSTPLYQRALTNSLGFTVASETVKIVIAIPLAMLLMRNFRGRKVVRALVVLPYAIPVFVAALAWRWMLDSTYGLVTWIVRALELGQPPVWLGESKWAIGSVILVNVWHSVPLLTIVLVAAITSVPQELVDASKVDGATTVQRLTHVMLPVMAPVVLVGQLFSFILIFSEMSIVWILTRGGPGMSTEVLPTASFTTAITSGHLGLGSAVSLLMVPIMVAVALVLLRFMNRGDGA
jgi:multiple sugar transport system permease protein